MSMAKRSGDQVAAAGEGFGGLLRAYRGHRRPSFRPEPAAACSPVSVAPRQLPPDIADFVGHTELVGKLQELFESRPGGTGAEPGVPPLVICAVAGKAGVGKSALAVHVAHRLASAFPDGQLYASLGGGSSEGWRSAARGPRSPLDPAEILSRLAGKRVLVVLDDAAGEAQLRPLLPGGPGPAVLITGRARPAALEGVHLVNLAVLDSDRAIALLGRIAGPQRVVAEPDAAAAIVAACGRLPLAVRIAGARLAARPHWPLTRMADLLADEHRRLATASWQLPPAVADDLLADPLAWFEAERAALMTAMHQASTPDLADTNGPAVELAWRLAGSMAGFFQLRSYRDDYRLACELALAAARQGGDRRGEAWMLVALAELLGDQDRFDEALTLARRARLLHHEVGDRHGEAYAWFVAAEIHRIKGQLTDATNELRQSWRLYSELDDDQGRAWVLHGLGTVYRLQGRLDEAAASLAQALTASRMGGDRRVEALVLKGLGLLHRSLTQPDQAVAYLLQSLRICRDLGDSTGEGYVLRALGDARLQRGEQEAAAAALQQALGVFRRVGSRRGEAAVLQSLGELDHAQARPHQARASLEAALVIQRELQILAPLARTLTALADVQAAAGDRRGAGRSRGEAHTLLQALGLPSGDQPSPPTPAHR
jgi:tetratricopeptide (TPR) repeat protein